MSLPQLDFQLKNLRSGEWVPLNGEVDLGGDAIALPSKYASELGIDLPFLGAYTSLSTPVGNFPARQFDIEAKILGVEFPTRIVLLASGDEILIGREPLLEHFDVLFHDGGSKMSLYSRGTARP